MLLSWFSFCRNKIRRRISNPTTDILDILRPILFHVISFIQWEPAEIIRWVISISIYTLYIYHHTDFVSTREWKLVRWVGNIRQGLLEFEDHKLNSHHCLWEESIDILYLWGCPFLFITNKFQSEYEKLNIDLKVVRYIKLPQRTIITLIHGFTKHWHNDNKKQAAGRIYI